MKFEDIVNEVLFPSDIKCIMCDGELSFYTRYGLCPECSKTEYNTRYCKRCGRHVGEMTPYCIECTNRSHDFDMARAPFVYKGEIRKLIYRLKYGYGAYLAKYMAQFMYDTYLENSEQIDCIAFVPIPKRRYISRGYNQAEEIAKELSLLSSIPVVDVLERSKYTKNLARMNKEERKQAISDSIKIRDGADVKGKRVMLIDDVFTSGATANECSKILKKAKADYVYVLTFATSTDKIQMY